MLLLLDTAQEKATVALAMDGKVMASEHNLLAKDHASWLHSAVERLLEKEKIKLTDLQAVAVVVGPGSYTGLRVAMAAAKGFCYALKIPLITLGSLRVMAESMKTLAKEKCAWLCPMIDARRDEVFTAMYHLHAATGELEESLAPTAMILDKNSFENELRENFIVFFGSGAEKWKEIVQAPHALFGPQIDDIQSFASLAQERFQFALWADPVYTEPVYLKEFASY